jgi:hypothetical protein
MADDAAYAAAASAVAANTATQAQVDLNNKAASQSRFMNPLAQAAQDAQAKAAKRS